MVSFLSACQNKDQKKQKSAIEELIESDSRYSSEMTRSTEDSTAVVQLATQYLDLLTKGDVESALGMVYELDGDNLTVLSDKRRSDLINMYRSFPVLKYKINDYSLFSETNTEVRFTYEFMDKQEGSNVPNTMKGSLCPIRHGNHWYLTVPDKQYSN